MISGQFSRTAVGAAVHRAMHQIREGGSIFADPLAARILGADAEPMLAEYEESPARRGLRLFIAIRSRVAEDAARRAIAEGLRQIVILGAGLDTFAYRLEPIEGLRVFEVDHAATQAEKRRRLAAAEIVAPAQLTYAPCDFERMELAEGLRAVGFDPERRSLFIWLGVTPYLSLTAISATLSFIAKLPGGAEIVFDYGNPPDTIVAPEQRRAHEMLAMKVAEAGEAFRTYFPTPELRRTLLGLGFDGINDMGPSEIAAKFFPDRTVPARANGGHVVWARSARA